MQQFASKKILNLAEIFTSYRTLLTQRTRLLVSALVLSFGAAIAEGLGLSIIYPLLDSVVGSGNLQGRVWDTLKSFAMYLSGSSVVEGLLYLAVGVFFLKAVLLAAHAAITSLWVGRLQEDWRLAALSHYLYGPYARVVDERRGQIIQNVIGEPASAAKGVEQLFGLLTKSVFALVFIATLFIINWQMTLAMIVLVCVVGAIIRPYLLRPVQRLGLKRMKAKQAMASVAAEPIYTASTIKLFGLESEVLRNLRHPLRKYTRANVLMAIFSKAPDVAFEFIIVAAVASIFIVLSRGFGIPFQEAAPLIGSFALVSSRLLTVVGGLLNKRLQIASVAPALALVHRLVSDGSSPAAVRRGDVLRKIETGIEFRNVSFGYVNDLAVFTDLSLVFPKGKMIGIVGPTGVGKSTIGNLIGRLYDPNSGAILINNRDIRDFSLESLRRRLGYVEQAPAVFNGTIAENILLGAPEASEEQIREAATAAGLHDFIVSLPNGYDTVVHDQGSTLSGGERQRLAIARAIIRRPDVFVFDEGTSSLDHKTEAAVQRSVQALVGDATVIVIAHRISTLKNADLIYEVLPGGEIVTRSFEEIAA